MPNCITVCTPNNYRLLLTTWGLLTARLDNSVKCLVDTVGVALALALALALTLWLFWL